MTLCTVIPGAARRNSCREFLGNPSIYPDVATMARRFVSTHCPQKIQRVVTRVKTGR